MNNPIMAGDSLFQMTKPQKIDDSVNDQRKCMSVCLPESDEAGFDGDSFLCCAFHNNIHPCLNPGLPVTITVFTYLLLYIRVCA